MTLLTFYPYTAPADEHYTYYEATGEKVNSFDWDLVQTGKTVEIESLNGDEKFYCNCTTAGATREWIYSTRRDIIRVVRDKNELHISGRSKGEDISAKVEIDEQPWFQALSYSLRKFNESPDEYIEFWHVRQDTLEPVKLSARRNSTVSNKFCQGEPAVAIEIRPVGLLSKIWRANYWFRARDNVFCRYEGRHGFLGTPLTIISLGKD